MATTAFLKAKEFYNRMDVVRRNSSSHSGDWSIRWLELDPYWEEMDTQTDNLSLGISLVSGKDYVEINLGKGYVCSIVPAGGVDAEANFPKW
jgi:hypothetical protein